MKVLYILENYYPNIGGAETLFKTLVDSILDEGYIVTVITNKTNRNLPFKESSDNLTIYRFPFKSRYAFTFLAWIPALYHAFKNDIIHTSSYNAGIPAFIASFVSRKKVLITFYEVWGELWFELPFFRKIGMWLHYIFEKCLLKLPFDRFIAISEFTKDSLIESGIKPDKIDRIYCGIDYEKLPQKIDHPNPTFRFLYFGRLGISKGLDILLSAIKILKKKQKDFVLYLIIPTKPYKLRQVILDLIIQYNISDKIIIMSNLAYDNLTEEIVKSDAVVVPSYSEGFCFSAVESIGMGMPIISSDRGALKEVVSGKYLKMEEFSGEGLAVAMNKALEGRWDNSAVNKYYLNTCIEEYKNLYKNISN